MFTKKEAELFVIRLYFILMKSNFKNMNNIKDKLFFQKKKEIKDV